MYCLTKYKGNFIRDSDRLSCKKVGNGFSTRMSRNWENDSIFSPGKKSRAPLDKKYSQYGKLYCFFTVTLKVPTIFSFIECCGQHFVAYSNHCSHPFGHMTFVCFL